MDATTVTIFKGGEAKTLDANISFFCGCNPRSDFWVNKQNLRAQIAFREGVISRFDVLLPLVSSASRNKVLLSQIEIFGEHNPPVNLDRVKSHLTNISNRMRKVRRVLLTDGQKRMVKEAFLERNEELENRPLLVLRDRL